MDQATASSASRRSKRSLLPALRKLALLRNVDPRRLARPLRLPDALGERDPGRAEAQAAQAAYRRRVRAASLAIVFGLAAVLAVSAVLPTTHGEDPAGLLFTSGLALVARIIWLALLP